MTSTTNNQQPATSDAPRLPRSARIYIAGHLGLVGGGIWRALERHGFTNLIGRSIDELDLINQQAVDEFFAAEKPEYVVLVAAKVGGIVANNTYRAQFIYENLMIEANVIHAAYKHGVKKLLFLGSSCIYPKLAPQPMIEEHLLTGPLEPTNEPYAIAKIAGIRLCDAYNRQYGTNFISAMPTNMYGPGDNYHPENSHVLPAFIRRMHLAHALERGDWAGIANVFNRERTQGNAKDDSQTTQQPTNEQPNHSPTTQQPTNEQPNHSPTTQQPTNEQPNHSPTTQQPTNEQLINWLVQSGITQTTINQQPSTKLACWGTGSPLREFLYSDDLAEACVFLLENTNYDDVAFEDDSGTTQSHINVGSGIEVSIRELAETVKAVVGFEGEIEWDTSRPDGTPRKLMDSSRLQRLGWEAAIDLQEGISRAYEDFLQRYAEAE